MKKLLLFGCGLIAALDVAAQDYTKVPGLQVNSPLADNATNVALVVNSANNWTQGSLLSLRNNSTNKIVMRPDGALLVGNGSINNPSIGWLSDEDGSGTGLYRSAANNLDFTMNGTRTMTMNNNGVAEPNGYWLFNRNSSDAIVVGRRAGLSFDGNSVSPGSGGGDTGFYNDAQGILSLRRTTTPHTNRIYATITGNAAYANTNAEWFEAGYDNVHKTFFSRSRVGTSGGTLRPLTLGVSTNFSVQVETNNDVRVYTPMKLDSYLTLSGLTNRLTDTGSALAYNGTPIGGGGIAGTMINTGASSISQIPRYTDTTGTNMAPSVATVDTGGVLSANSFNFVSDPDTYITNNAANQIGFATGGTVHWNILSDGTLEPTGSNTVDIGTSAKPVKNVTAKADFTGKRLLLDQGTITAGANQVNTTTTWNNSGVTFTNWHMNVVNTASGNNSKLFAITLGTGSGMIFDIDKNGVVTTSNTLLTPASSTSAAAIQLGPSANYPSIYTTLTTSTFGVTSNTAVIFKAQRTANDNYGISLGNTGYLYAPANGVLQLGEQVNGPTIGRSVLKSPNGNSGPSMGNHLWIVPGVAKGATNSGDFAVYTGLNIASVNTTNSVTPNVYVRAGMHNLTNNTVTTLFNVGVAATNYIALKVHVAHFATDGTDHQVRDDYFVVQAVNKAGTLTITGPTSIQSQAAASSGTYTSAITAVANGATVDIKTQPASSLTPTAMHAKWHVESMLSNGANDITPQ